MCTLKKAESNRRNAQKSTGPKTGEGKCRARLNSLKHGLTAKLDVLPGENPKAYRARLDAWTAGLRPDNEFERDLLKRAVRISRQLAWAQRAYVARATAKFEDAGSERAHAIADEVLALDARLQPDLRWKTRSKRGDRVCADGQ